MKDENKDFQQDVKSKNCSGKVSRRKQQSSVSMILKHHDLSLKITDRLIIKKKQTDYSKFPCMTLICLFSRSMT